MYGSFLYGNWPYASYESVYTYLSKLRFSRATAPQGFLEMPVPRYGDYEEAYRRFQTTQRTDGGVKYVYSKPSARKLVVRINFTAVAEDDYQNFADFIDKVDDELYNFTYSGINQSFVGRFEDTTNIEYVPTQYGWNINNIIIVED